MLIFSLHACRPPEVSGATRIGHLDLGYVRLHGVATYQAVLVTLGAAALAPVTIENYPRWSASIFDLALRAIVLSLERREELVLPPPVRRCAFANALTVVAEHVGVDGPRTRRRLGTLEITMSRTRGLYAAGLDEDLVGRRDAPRFAFTPQVLVPWALVACAIACCLTGVARLPPRPALIMPPILEAGGRTCIALGHLLEPARTGFERWLARHGITPTIDVEGTAGVVPDGLYARFLAEAI